MNMITRKIYIIVAALLFSTASFAQGYQVVDSTFNRTKMDQDSLYYDEMAYLDDYHFLDNIFLIGQLGISHSMSENTRFGEFFGNERLSFNLGVGKWVYPAFGVRFTLGLHPQVGRAEWELCEAYPETFGRTSVKDIETRSTPLEWMDPSNTVCIMEDIPAKYIKLYDNL